MYKYSAHLFNPKEKKNYHHLYILHVYLRFKIVDKKKFISDNTSFLWSLDIRNEIFVIRNSFWSRLDQIFWLKPFLKHCLFENGRRIYFKKYSILMTDFTDRKLISDFVPLYPINSTILADRFTHKGNGKIESKPRALCVFSSYE